MFLTPACLQTIILRNVPNAVYYVSAQTLHTDIEVTFVHDPTVSHYDSFLSSLS